ncbi:MAG: SUMF1/EgtB/PvdO family nonheme iron enzyme [Pseudomonadota bacterium]
MVDTANSSAQENLDPLPEDILELAALLAPAVHIDSTFLRNFRSGVLPFTDTGLEARFWHSELVASRSSSVITLDWEQIEVLGKAAFKGYPERFQECWQIIQELHRHLPGNLRLQEALRYAAITEAPIDEMVASIHNTLSELTDVEQRRSLGRWLKSTLPELPDADLDTRPVQWLAAVARAELGDSPAQFSQQEYDGSKDIPDWLFPERKIRPKQTIGLQLTPGVLSIVEPSQSEALLPLESANPTLLRVTWESMNGKTGGWLQTGPGNQLAIDEQCRNVEILVPDGRRFHLWAKRQDDLPEVKSQYVLLHLPEDRELAETLQGLLQEREISLELREETANRTRRDFSDRPVICLWTRTAAGYWQDLSTEKAASPSGVLLRTDSAVSLPQGAGAADAIDLLDLQNADSLEQAISRLRGLQPGEQKPRYSPEVRKLLDEINNPATEPRRRLEIGDRLAELGDPRPGVGVYEADSNLGADSESGKPTEFEATHDYSSEVQSLLDEINTIETPPKRRLAIGDELAKLGDPRPGIGLDERGLPDIDWVEIPAGPFIYGEGREQQEIDLKSFMISRYPITHLQFQAFIDAGGYKDKRWWKDLKKPKPEKSRWDQPNRPRTDMDWYEAVAFTRWLAAQLNQPIRLPTEQEWEKAARGTDGRAFPWGDEYINGTANVDESSNKGDYLEQTTAVGLYPQGQSPFNVMDMASNVWEWCLNKYDHPEQIEPDTTGDSRVLRGGSWFNNPEFARAAFRGRLNPFVRDDDCGFRVVLSAPIS